MSDLTYMDVIKSGGQLPDGMFVATWNAPEGVVTGLVEERYARWDAERWPWGDRRELLSFMNAKTGLLLRVHSEGNRQNEILLTAPSCWELCAASEVYDLLYPEQT